MKQCIKSIVGGICSFLPFAFLIFSFSFPCSMVWSYGYEKGVEERTRELRLEKFPDEVRRALMFYEIVRRCEQNDLILDEKALLRDFICALNRVESAYRFYRSCEEAFDSEEKARLKPFEEDVLALERILLDEGVYSLDELGK